jgi:hypothetical protein
MCSLQDVGSPRACTKNGGPLCRGGASRSLARPGRPRPWSTQTPKASQATPRQGCPRSRPTVRYVASGPALGRGPAWQVLERERQFLKKHVEDGVRLTKVHDLLARRGVAVPYRTLHRFCATEFGSGRRGP